MHLLECTRLRNKGVHVLTIHNAKGKRSRGKTAVLAALRQGA